MLGILMGLGAALCWAIEPSLYVLGMKDTPPLLANAIRTLSAGLFSLVIAIFWENFLSLLPFDPIQVVFLVGVTFIAMGFGDWLYFRCLNNTEVSFVAGMIHIYPLFVALFTILFGTEKISPLVLVASTIIVSGVILIGKTKNSGDPRLVRHHSQTLELKSKVYMKTSMFAILVAFTWGITIFGLGFSLQYFPPLSANAIRIVSVGSLLCLIFFSHPSKGAAEKPSKVSLGLLVIGGILGLGIGAWMMLISIKLLGAAKSSSIISVSPFFTALIAILVLKEKPTLSRLGGILLVCLGVLLISVS